MVFVEDVGLFAGKVLRCEHEIVGEVKGLHDALGGIHRVEEAGTVLAVGLHGIRVVHENGDYITLFGGFRFAVKERLCEGQHKTSDT